MKNEALRNHAESENYRHAERVGKLLKLIAHPHRLMILCMLSEEERNVTELVAALGVNQSAVSNHLAKLRSAGIVAYTRYHRIMQYRISSPEVCRLLNTLCEIYRPAILGLPEK